MYIISKKNFSLIKTINVEMLCLDGNETKKHTNLVFAS